KRSNQHFSLFRPSFPSSGFIRVIRGSSSSDRPLFLGRQDMASAPGPASVWRLLQRTEFGLLAAIALVVLLTGLFDSQHTYFTSPRPSAVAIPRQTALLGIFTLGAAIVIIAGGIDLSSGSVIAFSGTICAIILLLLAPEEMKAAVPSGSAR